MNIYRCFLILLLILSSLAAARAAEIHHAVSTRDRLRVEKILTQTPSAARVAKNKGITPLHIAAALNYSDIAELLIRNGADVNARLDNGYTSLHWAASRNSAETALLLIYEGANVSLKSDKGITALDRAVKTGSKKTAEIIRAALVIKHQTFATWKKFPKPVKPSAVTFKTQGKIQSRLNFDIDKYGEGEAEQSLDTLARIESRIGLKKAGLIFFFSGDTRSEIFNLEKGNADFTATLREAYGEIRGKKYVLGIGRQIVTWGKLDEIAILDRISPHDYDWFALNNKQDRKLPVMMLRIEYFWKNAQAEALVLPKFDPAQVKYFGTDWSIFGHMKDLIAAGSYPQQIKDAVNAITIGNGKSPKDPEFAIRLRTKLRDTDYGFYAMSLLDRMPGLKEQTAKGALVKGFLFAPSAENMLNLITAGQQDLLIKEDYKRNTVLGMDFETVAGEYGIRGELAFLSAQPVNRADFTLTRKNIISAGIGLDHTAANNVYFNIQAAADLILDYEPLHETKRFSHQFTLNINRDFLLDDLHTEAGLVYRATYGDWMANPLCSYKIKHGFEIESGLFLFGGKPWTLFGRFDTKDLAYLNLRYRF
ncbi:MAG: ankyrin repeat domain-containing protein [Elusimicrobia bacterium]|nr:ankyrin repeat domain-containing protein [Candidatus Omnitrophota bacterium]MCG2725014.1 ankyrin repeat domain-containing protein [Elusimicrobiota bacterium]